MGGRGLAAATAAAIMMMGTVESAAVAQPAAPPQAPKMTLPRTADGHPDLSGSWGDPELLALAAAFFGGNSKPDPKAKDLTVTAPVRNGDFANFTNDAVIMRRNTTNLPLYKPEYWDTVADLDWNGNLRDPYNSCYPPGAARMGAPRRIVQTPGEVFLFYSVPFQRNDFRAVPVADKRNHPVDRDGTWNGDPLAHWEGDDLVVETIGFNAESWLGPQGYIHGYDMKLTERFHPTPEGLIYQETVEDPEYLQRPWVMNPVKLVKLPPFFHMDEPPPCSERDAKSMIGKQREM